MEPRTFWQAWSDRRAARIARRAPPATGFALPPEPPLSGHFGRGRLLAEGSFHLAGHTVETRDPWAAAPPSAEFAAALHGFAWLDDLAACGDGAARAAAQGWVAGWIARHGRGRALGRGPAWRPELVGRRVLRWVRHGLFLTAGAEAGAQAALFAALGHQTAFLARRHAAVAAGPERVEAAAGWLTAALLLAGLPAQAGPALAALTAAAEATIEPDGGLAARNPEALFGVLRNLVWCREALAARGTAEPEALSAALRRGARALRALRHVDGGLARFHGGGAGPEGEIDRIIDAAAPGDRVRPAQAMGFLRLDGGRTSVIVDAAPPPRAAGAQASTLGFELTSGRRPLVVGCGNGADFGPDWDAAARATAAASTLTLEGAGSARVIADRGRPPRLEGGPTAVTRHRTDERGGSAVLLGHDGWVASHGLTHTRHLDLSSDGRALMGEDALAAVSPEDRARLAAVQAGRGGTGPAFALRFHLHPAVEARPDPAGDGIALALPSGERWRFRFDGRARLALEPSVWLEPGRRAPRPCRQIVLRGTLSGTAARIGWTLAKAQDTPLAIRDTGRDEDFALPADFYDRD